MLILPHEAMELKMKAIGIWTLIMWGWLSAGFAIGSEGDLFSSAIAKFETGKFHAALEDLNQHSAISDARNTEVQIFLGQIYYRLNEYQVATRYMERGVAAALLEGTEVRERWLQLLRFLYWELGDYENAIATIEDIQKDYPDPIHEDWLVRLRFLVDASNDV
jgi:tetratricopeptide (TPR) repeat protein